MALLQLQVFTIKEATGEKYYLLRKKANFFVESRNTKKSTRLFLKSFRSLILGKESNNIWRWRTSWLNFGAIDLLKLQCSETSVVSFISLIRNWYRNHFVT